jgi:alpha-1,2-mannosyltransferase
LDAHKIMPRRNSLPGQLKWLTRDRVAAWGILLLVQEVLLLSLVVLWLDGVVGSMPIPASSDFVSFYAAGKLTLAGTPALAYDQMAHYLAEQKAGTPGAPYILFFYPPVFLFLCAALAKLPYYIAYLLFEMTTLALFAYVIRGILQEKGWAWIPPLLAFPAVVWTIGLGQNAFLTATLFGAFTLLIDRRPVTAGLLIGLLCYKPHFGLLIPVALAAGRHWRALIAASLTTAVLIGASYILFGWETWRVYLIACAGAGEIYASGRVAFAAMLTPFGAALLLGLDLSHAYITQAIATFCMVVITALIWRRGATCSGRGAMLPVATLLAVPLALVYDELLALVAIAWLVREGRAQGFLPWDKSMLLSLYPLSLLTLPIGMAWHIPLGPVISFIVLILCLLRVWQGDQAPLHSATEDGVRGPRFSASPIGFGSVEELWTPRRLVEPLSIISLQTASRELQETYLDDNESDQ